MNQGNKSLPRMSTQPHLPPPLKHCQIYFHLVIINIINLTSPATTFETLSLNHHCQIQSALQPPLKHYKTSFKPSWSKLFPSCHYQYHQFNPRCHHLGQFETLSKNPLKHHHQIYFHLVIIINLTLSSTNIICNIVCPVKITIVIIHDQHHYHHYQYSPVFDCSGCTSRWCRSQNRIRPCWSLACLWIVC